MDVDLDLNVAVEVNVDDDVERLGSGYRVIRDIEVYSFSNF